MLSKVVTRCLCCLLIFTQTEFIVFMNWDQLLSTKRFGQEQLHLDRKDDRTEFKRDYDRLIFSAPFRRLQNKTQVFPPPGQHLRS